MHVVGHVVAHDVFNPLKLFYAFNSFLWPVGDVCLSFWLGWPSAFLGFTYIFPLPSDADIDLVLHVSLNINIPKWMYLFVLDLYDRIFFKIILCGESSKIPTKIEKKNVKKQKPLWKSYSLPRLMIMNIFFFFWWICLWTSWIRFEICDCW